MSIRAGFLGLIHPHDVFLRRYWLKMVWVDATLVATKVVEVQFAAHGSNQAGIQAPVGKAAQTVASGCVEVAVPRWVKRCCPEPASILRELNLGVKLHRQVDAFVWVGDRSPRPVETLNELVGSHVTRSWFP